jgi:2-phospho-L-lactate guanylyltransferase
MDAGILPVKRLDAAKSRLDAYFDLPQRRELARAMVEDALDLCSDAPFLRWHVLTADATARSLARERGLETIEDPPEAGLNAALRHAIDRLRGAESVTIIPADAPLATPSELQDILDTGSTSDVVVVPADRDAGTNGLFLSPPDLTEPRFGESSFRAYVKWAEEAQVRCSILPLDGFSLDVDTIEDVEKVVAEASSETRTVRLLRRLMEGRA